MTGKKRSTGFKKQKVFIPRNNFARMKFQRKTSTRAQKSRKAFRESSKVRHGHG